MPSATAATDLATSPATRVRGLTEAEAAARAARGEGNTAAFETSRSYRRILRENAFTAINLIFFVIALLLVILGNLGDAVMTAGLALANVVVSVLQERRAKRQLDRIALLTRPRATVIRDGQERAIDPVGIVRGDMLVVRPGDQIVVNGQVLETAAASVDESPPTGESDLVPKRTGNPVCFGSYCMAGSAVYVAERGGPAASLSRSLSVPAPSAG
jgi:cation-transporting ATPase E